MPGKTWRECIGSALNEARCILVVWSHASIDSHWVVEEAEEGKVRNILVPVRIDSVVPPLGFRSIQMADLSHWGGEKSSFLLNELIDNIRTVIGISQDGLLKDFKPSISKSKKRPLWLFSPVALTILTQFSRKYFFMFLAIVGVTMFAVLRQSFQATSPSTNHSSDTYLPKGENILDYLSVSLARKGDTIQVLSSRKRKIRDGPMDYVRWKSKVAGLEELVSNSSIANVDDVGISIGVQNFLYHDVYGLLVGIRLKSKDNSGYPGTRSIIIKGGLNAGNSLVREPKDMPSDIESVADMFTVVSTEYRKLSPAGAGSKVYQALISRCKIGIDCFMFRLPNGQSHLAVVSVNDSRIFPRIEVGLIRIIDISSLITDKVPLISTFGEDKYEDENYWLWLSDGKIVFRSYKTGRVIPGVHFWDSLYHQRGILVSNDHLLSKGLVRERYVALSDEDLNSQNTEILVYPTISAPGRAVARLF